MQDSCDNNEKQMRRNFQDNYLDHMSNLKIEAKPSQNALTTIACAIRMYYKYKLYIDV